MDFSWELNYSKTISCSFFTMYTSGSTGLQREQYTLLFLRRRGNDESIQRYGTF